MKFISHLFLMIAISFGGCKEKPQPTNKTLQRVSGKTMGTYYSVQYYGDEDISEEADSILLAVNQSLSTYIPGSIISSVNQADTNQPISVDEHFIINFKKAVEVYNETSGSFNPAVMPLVNYWGFGFERFNESSFQVDSAEVERLVQLADFSQFQLNGQTITKSRSESALDFSALAKGYGVDAIAEYLLANHIQNFIVEIGGETRANGLKADGKPWVVGIRKPSINKNERSVVTTTINLQNQSIATSGNYENYIQLPNFNQQTISHTINPETGFPQPLEDEILSSTVITTDCMTADAFATAFKVMGLQTSKQVIANVNELQEDSLRVYFIYKHENEIAEWSSY